MSNRVFINFCHLNTEYCMSYLLTKLGGGEGGVHKHPRTPPQHGIMGCTLMLMSSCIRVPRLTRQGRKVPLAVPTTIFV